MKQTTKDVGFLPVLVCLTGIVLCVGIMFLVNSDVLKPTPKPAREVCNTCAELKKINQRAEKELNQKVKKENALFNYRKRQKSRGERI